MASRHNEVFQLVQGAIIGALAGLAWSGGSMVMERAEKGQSLFNPYAGQLPIAVEGVAKDAELTKTWLSLYRGYEKYDKAAFVEALQRCDDIFFLLDRLRLGELENCKDYKMEDLNHAQVAFENYGVMIKELDKISAMLLEKEGPQLAERQKLKDAHKTQMDEFKQRHDAWQSVKFDAELIEQQRKAATMLQDDDDEDNDTLDDAARKQRQQARLAVLPQVPIVPPEPQPPAPPAGIDKVLSYDDYNNYGIKVRTKTQRAYREIHDLMVEVRRRCKQAGKLGNLPAAAAADKVRKS